MEIDLFYDPTCQQRKSMIDNYEADRGFFQEMKYQINRARAHTARKRRVQTAKAERMQPVKAKLESTESTCSIPSVKLIK